MQDLNPFISWVGGKTPIIESLLLHKPKEFMNYYEPFVGSGKLLMTLRPVNKVVINDINPQLMNTYEIIKSAPLQLIEKLKLYEDKNTKEYYNHYRQIYNDSESFYKMNKIDQAAIFLYLMHACYRGLYRVNSKGGFNVGYGNRPPSEFIINYENLINISTFLNQHSIIHCGDFKQTIEDCQKDDFVYLDPPYYESFNEYDKKKFTIEDFEELRIIFDQLHERGCKVLMSNNNHEFICELFKGYNIFKIDAPNNINASDNREADKEKRSEIVIRNY